MRHHAAVRAGRSHDEAAAVKVIEDRARGVGRDHPLRTDRAALDRLHVHSGRAPRRRPAAAPVVDAAAQKDRAHDRAQERSHDACAEARHWLVDNKCVVRPRGRERSSRECAARAHWSRTRAAATLVRCSVDWHEVSTGAAGGCSPSASRPRSPPPWPAAGSSAGWATPCSTIRRRRRRARQDLAHELFGEGEPDVVALYRLPDGVANRAGFADAAVHAALAQHARARTARSRGRQRARRGRHRWRALGVARSALELRRRQLARRSGGQGGGGAAPAPLLTLALEHDGAELRVRPLLGGLVPSGLALTRLARQSLARSERIALPIVAVLLVVIFGSVVAALLPLIIGGLSIVLTLGVLYLLAPLITVDVFALNVVTILGLGVAIDYALFLVSRYREEVAGGAAPEQALVHSVETAGRSVLFSGVTVAASLGGLFVFSQPFLRSVAIGGLAVVLSPRRWRWCLAGDAGHPRPASRARPRCRLPLGACAERAVRLEAQPLAAHRVRRHRTVRPLVRRRDAGAALARAPVHATAAVALGRARAAARRSAAPGHRGVGARLRCGDADAGRAHRVDMDGDSSTRIAWRSSSTTSSACGASARRRRRREHLHLRARPRSR